MTDPQPVGAVAHQSRRGSRALGNALLNLAALGGLVCIVLVLLSVFFNISLIMFKTGSMSPTIPAGSLAVVREIPAADIRVGDVLTVDRPGMLPVTHRVTSVAGEGDARTITMRGDANEAEDPAPYTVTEARRVLASVPHLARGVVWLSNPLVLGGLTIGAAVLVTWAFWPRERERPRNSKLPRHGAAASALVVVGTGIGLLGVPLGPDSAHAVLNAEMTERTRGAITLISSGDTRAMRVMRPGVPVPWQVGVRVVSEEASTVAVSLTAAGSPEFGLVLDVRACDVRWVRGTCTGNESAASGQGPIEVETAPTRVAVLHGTSERWFLITATMPEAIAGSVELTLRAAGGSDVVSTTPGGENPAAVAPQQPPAAHAGGWAALSRSGVSVGSPWLLGIVAIAGGLMTAGAARLLRYRRREPVT